METSCGPSVHAYRFRPVTICLAGVCLFGKCMTDVRKVVYITYITNTSYGSSHFKFSLGMLLSIPLCPTPCFACMIVTSAPMCLSYFHPVKCNSEKVQTRTRTYCLKKKSFWVCSPSLRKGTIYKSRKLKLRSQRPRANSPTVG